MNEQCVNISIRLFMCTLTERDQESSKLRASVFLHVKRVSASGHYHQGEETDSKTICRYSQLSKPLYMNIALALSLLVPSLTCMSIHHLLVNWYL